MDKRYQRIVERYKRLPGFLQKSAINNMKSKLPKEIWDEIFNDLFIASKMNVKTEIITLKTRALF